MMMIMKMMMMMIVKDDGNDDDESNQPSIVLGPNTLVVRDEDDKTRAQELSKDKGSPEDVLETRIFDAL